MAEELIPQWPCAYGGPSGSGTIKAQPEDFIVEEMLPFQTDGNGEHVFLHIEKRGQNTEYVARQLARLAGVRQHDIGFAGLKDRHGQTRQWFSIWLPGKDAPVWSDLESESLKILAATRHARKLKRGALAGNRFSIVLRNWQGDRALTEQRLKAVADGGFPNYFGEQRFGHQGRNLEKALAMFQGARVKREQRSIYLSAARSYLFNLILAERVASQTWHVGLAGDVLNLNDSHSRFPAPVIDEALERRLAQGDLHPTGALWGRGELATGGDAARLEWQIVADHNELTQGLEQAGLEQERRALRVLPTDLHWSFDDDKLALSFGLPAGSYATALLREIVALPTEDENDGVTTS